MSSGARAAPSAPVCSKRDRYAVDAASRCPLIAWKFFEPIRWMVDAAETPCSDSFQAISAAYAWIISVGGCTSSKLPMADMANE